MKQKNKHTSENDSTKEQTTADEAPEKKVDAPTVDEATETEKEPDTTAETERLQQEIDELKERHLRLMAEYENFRKRTLKEKADLIKNGTERVLTHFLEVLDDFDLAIEHLGQSTDVEGLREGVALIHAKVLTLMKAQGIHEIETIGQPFDPEVFDAIAMQPTESEEQKGKVIACVKKGYRLNDKVIRHPKVVVGQ